jgi:protein-S-isoprenylcysteine O-methyltransferase Ste14
MSLASDHLPDHAGVLVPPPLVYLAFFLVGLVLERYAPLLPLRGLIGRVVGAVLILFWLTLTIWSVRRFRASRTSLVPVRSTTALVIEGPYRFTRNPMYLGLLMLYVGTACWFGLLWPLLLAPALVAVVQVFVIGREERYLTRKFGDEYRRYQRQVRRWV